MSTPPGSTTFESTQTPPIVLGAQIVVSRYMPSENSSRGTWQDMPNVVCSTIQDRPFQPRTARFRYRFEDPYPQWPQRFDEVFDYNRGGGYVLAPDDRVVVRLFLPDGSWVCLFEGYVLVPQTDASEAQEVATIQALGTPVREWDAPLPGAIYRDTYGTKVAPGTGATTNVSTDTLVEDIQTDLPIQFNPYGHANATGSGGDTALQIGSGLHYPVFCDWRTFVDDAEDDTIFRHWTLGMAARYVILNGNPDETYTQIGDLSGLDVLLQAITPTTDGGVIDPNDSSTFKREDIIVPDVDVSGHSWPEALQMLIEPHGFRFQFLINTDSSGSPTWQLDIFRTDTLERTKTIYLDDVGATLDFGRTNTVAISMQRDSGAIANQWYIQSEPLAYEASFVLAPAFPMAAGDVSNDYRTASDDTDSPIESDAYRVFIFGENLKDPVYLNGTSDMPGGLAGLGDLFAEGSTGSDPRVYVTRRRPPLKSLLSLDGEDKPKEAQLWFSTNYTGNYPALWDPAKAGGKTDLSASPTTWQRIDDSAWKLLPDRIGIRITANNPDAIPLATAKSLGNKKKPNLRLVQSLAAPTDAQPAVVFRLTCVIEGDHDLDVISKRRQSSPTKFTTSRYDDCRDRFRKRIVSKYSHLNPNVATYAAEDDTTEAQAHADGRRRANEYGKFAGTFSLPWISLAYAVGDKIDGVAGRQVSFNGLAAVEQNEQPVFPTITGTDYTLDPEQTTVYHLEDLRAEEVLPPKQKKFEGLSRAPHPLLGRPGDIPHGDFHPEHVDPGLA